MTTNADAPARNDGLEAQLGALSIDAGRPLLISDADEVLFAFMATFERHLADEGARFNWRSFRLNGNILDRATGEAIDREGVLALLVSCFDRHTAAMPTVPGAAAVLARLSARLQVVVLSNLPHERRAERQAALAANGMPFPVVSNEGSKAGAVRALAERTCAPVFFIDDSPTHHEEVAEAAPDVMRIHFIGDDRLAKLLGPAPAAHLRARDWGEIGRCIEERLDGDAAP